MTTSHSGVPLAYVVGDECWYADSLAATGDHGKLWVRSGSTEIIFTQHSGASHGPALSMTMYDDAFPALADQPELFARLVKEQPVTLDGLRAILAELGAEDQTPREGPQGQVADRGPVYTAAQIRAGVGLPRGAVFRMLPLPDADQAG